MSGEYKFIVEGINSAEENGMENGSKGIFGEPVHRLQEKIEIGMEQMTKELGQFCTNFCEALPKIENSEFTLDEVEIKVEFSASGEIKIIGGAGAGIVGGMNLKFKKKS